MSTNPALKKFIRKLKKEKTEAELVKYLADLAKFSAAELYMALLFNLNDEDIEVIDKIDDDALAEKEMRRRFKQRTKISPEEFVTQLTTELAKTSTTEYPE